MNTTTHNITADSDYTLTSEQNNFGKVIITDTGVVLTGAINIIMSDEEKDFIIHNDTAQTLTIKTNGGAGISLLAGKTIWLLCDGTDAILASDGLEIASTAEAQAGTDNTKAITSLRLHEAMIGGVEQSWQDVTASRSLGIVYTNTSGRPIMVAVRVSTTASANQLHIDVDGLTITYTGTGNTGTGLTQIVLVPHGSTYTANVGSATLNSWHELR